MSIDYPLQKQAAISMAMIDPVVAIREIPFRLGWILWYEYRG